MQTASTAYTNAVSAVARNVSYKFEVMWNGTTWTDESARLQPDFDGSLRLSQPGGELIPPGDVGRLMVNLDNNDGRYSWKNAFSPLAGYIYNDAGLGYKKVRLSVGFASEWCVIFVGVIAGWQEAMSYIALDIRDMGWLYLQLKGSTTLYVATKTATWIDTLADLAGVPAGDQLISPFIYTLPFAWLDDESILEEMWSAAGSEAGRVWFDELGRLRAEPAPYGANTTSPVWNFGSAYVDATTNMTTESVVNKITAEWSGRAVGGEAVLWSLDQRRVIPPGGTIEIEAKFSQAAATVFAVTTARNKDVFVSSAGGGDMMANLTVSVVATYAQRQKLSLANSHTKWTMVVNRLQLRGIPLLGGPDEQAETTASTNPLSKDRVRSLPANPYIQTREQATTSAAIVAARYTKVQHTIPLRGAPGVPMLELGDRVAVTLSDGSAAAGYVQSIAFRCENGGFVQDIEIAAATDMFEFSNYFIIGTTALGANGRAWH